MTAPGRTGVLLLAHGARHARWAEPFEAVLGVLRERCPGAVVRLAFLEFMAPDPASAARALVEQEGCTRLEILPLFLGAGGHVQAALPALAAQVQARHPRLDLRVHPALGEWPSVLHAIAEAAAQRVAIAP